jgi:hypothetical protein
MLCIIIVSLFKVAIGSWQDVVVSRTIESVGYPYDKEIDRVKSSPTAILILPTCRLFLTRYRSPRLCIELNERADASAMIDEGPQSFCKKWPPMILTNRGWGKVCESLSLSSQSGAILANRGVVLDHRAAISRSHSIEITPIGQCQPLSLN